MKKIQKDAWYPGRDEAKSGSPASGLRRMVTHHEAFRLEDGLRADDLGARSRALGRLRRLTSDQLTQAMEMAGQQCRPVLLGTLLALEAGEVPSLATLVPDAVRRVALALGGRSVSRRKAATRSLVHGNVSLKPATAILERWARDPRLAVRRATAAVCGDPFQSSYLHTSDVALVEDMLGDPAMWSIGVGEACHLVKRLHELLTAVIKKRAGKGPGNWLPRQSRKSAAMYAISEALRGLYGLSLELARVHDVSDPNVRALVARSHGTIVMAANPAIGALVNGLADSDSGVSREASLGLQWLRRGVSVPASKFFPLLESTLPHVRANAIRFLPYALTEPRPGWDCYERALDDPEPEVRAAALETLRATISAVPESVMTRMKASARRGRPWLMRINAAHSVAHFAADKKPWIATIIAGMRSKDRQVRIAASGALWHLANHATGALPILVRSAESDREPNVRHRALWALEAMGPAAASARRAVERLCRDPDRDVQRFAGRALQAIQA